MLTYFIMSSSVFPKLIFSPLQLNFLSMSPRRSPRKKATSPESVVDSDNEDFEDVASDISYVI